MRAYRPIADRRRQRVDAATAQPDPRPIPDQAARAGLPGHPRAARVATSAAFAAQGLMLTVLLTHLPQFTDRHGIAEGTVTLVVLLVTVLAAGGSLLSETLAAATSSRTALRAGLLLLAAAAGLIALAPELPLFVVGFAVYGLGLGAVDAAGNMQAVALQHRYGRSIIASFHAAWSGAAILGALSVAVGERIDVPLTASVLGAATAVLVIALVAGPRLVPAGPVTRATGTPHTQAETPITGTPHPGVGTPATGTATRSGEAPTTTAAPKAGTGHAPASAAWSRPLVLLGLAMACFWAVDSAVSNWSALYLRDALGASDSTAALGFALYQAAALASRLAGDLVVRRHGAVATVRAGALIGTAGTLLVLLAPGPALALAGFLLAGLGLPVIAPLCFGAAGAAVRVERGGADPQVVQLAADRAVARLNVYTYLGSLLGAVLVGGLATVADLRAGFAVPVVLAIAALPLAAAFAPTRSRRCDAASKV